MKSSMTRRDSLRKTASGEVELVYDPTIAQEKNGRPFGIGSMQDAVKLPYIKLDEFTECVDDTRSSFYNQIVNRMQVGNFDWKSSEKMFTVRPQYELGVFVAYNSYPAIRGNGSCIFLHIWKDATTATSGCTAMAREELERIVKWLDPAKNPYLVQMTEAEYNSHRRSLRLPKLK